MTGKRLLYFAAIIISIVGLASVYYLFNPAKYGFFPKCPFYTLTGFYCPGCGSQRALYFLLHGNIKDAIRENILMIISIPFLLIHFFFKGKSLVLNKDLRWGVIYHPLTPKIILAIVIFFWITRNIPYHPFNYLSPGQ